jgi:DNA-directed RNA polymerase subunit beta'
VQIAYRTPDGRLEPVNRPVLDSKLFGRSLAEDIKIGRVTLFKRGTSIGDPELRRILEASAESADLDTVQVKSVLTCDAIVGVCQQCYGRSLAAGRPVDIGESVGIIAAQSIGEPGTQLTMRTFHTGGVAGEDITHGLPRVQELFEARKPKGEAVITELAGGVAIEEDDREVRITVTSEEGDQVQYKVSRRARLAVADGETVEVGQQLTEGSVNPHDKLRVEGIQALQLHLVDEVQEVYRSQGVTIHDKHIELIVRQMLRKVQIIEPGDTDFLPGELIDRKRFQDRNADVVDQGGEPASARPILMGITKASLATDSWLAAASFQETTRVLTEAAISARSDPLLGLKENVIIGKLIPAGTGMGRYRNIAVRIKPEAIPEYWLARQRELAEAREAGAEQQGMVGTMTREEAEQALGGVFGLDDA